MTSTEGLPAHQFEKVVLIHGIRTQASWFEMVASVLRDQCGLSITPLRYGYFDAFRFLLPGLTRKRPIEIVARELRSVLQNYPPGRVLVIAHSFGTYIITKVLSENPDICLGGLIMCGSVVSEEFRWDINGRSISKSRIVNECGDRDIWPNLAKSLSWGYGATGRFGFGVDAVRDRFHDLSHSEFFSKEFVLTYWVPLTRNWEIVAPQYENQRGIGPWWLGMLSVFPVKTVLLAAVIFQAYVVASPFIPTKTASGAASQVATSDAVSRDQNNDFRIVPSLDLAVKTELVVKRDQLQVSLASLTQQETPITANGYFNLVVPPNQSLAQAALHPEIATQAGVTLKTAFQPNLYLSVQAEAIENIRSIDLIGCNIALIVKRKEKAIMFWSSESDASRQYIPVNVDLDSLNTIALRQVGKDVTAFINGEVVGTYHILSGAHKCSPALQFKVLPGTTGQAFFQGLAVYEFR